MITNMWDRIEVYCDNEQGKESEPVKMELDTLTLEYKCSKCKNKISTRDFEKLLNEISKKLMDAEMNCEIANLENEKWTTKGIKYKIFEDKEKIKVLVLNKGAFK